MLRLPYKPSNDPRHRTAVLALFRALIRSARAVPLSPDELLRPQAAARNPIVKVIRKRFAKNSRDTSPRLIFAAMAAGYRFLTVLAHAKEGPETREHRIVLGLLNAPAIADERGERRKEWYRLWDSERRKVKPHGWYSGGKYRRVEGEIMKARVDLQDIRQPLDVSQAWLGGPDGAWRKMEFEIRQNRRGHEAPSRKVMLGSREQLQSNETSPSQATPQTQTTPHSHDKPPSQDALDTQSKPRSPTKPTHEHNTDHFLINTAPPDQTPRYVLSFKPSLRSAHPRIASTSQGQPFLRFCKPQPHPMTRAIARRDALWSKRVDGLITYDETYFPEADCEDAWDALVAAELCRQLPPHSPHRQHIDAQTRPNLESTFCWSVKLSRRWIEFKMDCMWKDWIARGDALSQFLDEHYDRVDAAAATTNPRPDGDKLPAAPETKAAIAPISQIPQNTITSAGPVDNFTSPQWAQIVWSQRFEILRQIRDGQHHVHRVYQSWNQPGSRHV